MTSLNRALFGTGLLLSAGFSALAAPSFFKSQPVSFYREVAPRDLEGLALRSDGRIVAGPTLRDLAGNPLADLWWDLEPLQDNQWLVGAGPDGRVLLLEVDPAQATFTASGWAETEANHVFVLKRLPDGRVIGGTHPGAVVYVWNAQGSEIARVSLPADSVLDLLVEASEVVWAATGNPGTLYRIDVDRLVATGSREPLAERGVVWRGQVRDRNLRRLARTAEGTILAGSAPSGNLYAFHADQSEPLILMDHDTGEITDIHVAANGDVYTTLVVAGESAQRRLIQSTSVQSNSAETDQEKPEPDTRAPSIMEAPPLTGFSGRSELTVLPGGTGLPETLSARNQLAMYRIIPYTGGFVLPGGDDGELVGYDPIARRALSFPGSTAAQLNDIERLGSADRFLVLTNNPTGLALLDFEYAGTRRARTGSINLQTPSEIGALWFNRLRDISPADIAVRMRASRGQDAIEGWTPWVRAEPTEGSWQAPGLIGRQVQIELALPADIEHGTELDQAEIFFLPQNRRPVLRSFRLISPNFGLNARPPPDNSTRTMTLGQVIGTSPSSNQNPSEQDRQALLTSQVVPQLGAQIAMWTASDPDGDTLTATFAVRPEHESTWIELLVDGSEDWFQFDRRPLAEGTYHTQLTLSEGAPRPVADRKSVTFATDDLVIDHTAPVIESVELRPESSGVTISVTARDARSRLSGVSLKFNNGHTVELSQPVDGMIDSLREVFATTIRVDQLVAATAVEVYVEDAVGNISVRRETMNL